MNLNADVEVEVSSGEKRIIKQGDVFFVEDTTGGISVVAHTCGLYYIALSVLLTVWLL